MTSDRGRVFVFALLLASQPLAGCVGDGAREAWWETSMHDWPAWEGLGAVPVRPGAVPWLSSYVEEVFDETVEAVDTAYGQSVASGYVQSADWYVSEANRSLEANATTWALRDIATARHLLESIGAKDEHGRTDEKAVARYLDDKMPLEAWRALEGELDEAWREPNVTALPLLFSLMDGWRPAEFGYELLSGEELDAMETMLKATRVATFAGIASPVAENATSLAGPPLAPTGEETFEPLLEASAALVEITRQAPESYLESGHFSPHHGWGVQAEAFSKRGWTVAAAAAAMTALVYAHTLHWSHEERVPTQDRVLQGLEDLARSESPMRTFFAHMAWNAYASGGQDPAFVLVPVAIAELSPLIEALDERLIDGTPIPWEQTLDPLLEDWQEGWMGTTRAAT